MTEALFLETAKSEEESERTERTPAECLRCAENIRRFEKWIF